MIEDPRLKAAVKAWDHHWGDRYGDEAIDEMGEEVAVALAAADQADREQGIHRVKVDDATVERLARTMFVTAGHMEGSWVYLPPESSHKRLYMAHARAVLAALTGATS